MDIKSTWMDHVEKQCDQSYLLNAVEMSKLETQD